MNDDGRPATPMLPYDELRSAIGDDPSARNELDALRGIHDAEARVANWWDDPLTQTWFKALGDAGL